MTSATAGSGSYDIYVNPTATLGAPNVSAIGRTNQSSYLVGPAGQQNTPRLTPKDRRRPCRTSR